MYGENVFYTSVICLYVLDFLFDLDNYFKTGLYVPIPKIA